MTKKYGEIQGITINGVKAYSNGTPENISQDSNYHEGTYTGMKWQCVEFVRRWLIQTRNLTFSNVDYAYNIWDQATFNPTDSNQQAVTSRFENGSIPNLKKGDLLIYTREFRTTGHVAIIEEVSLSENFIKISEQNFNSEAWAENHSRAIPFVLKNDLIQITQKNLLGTLRIK